MFIRLRPMGASIIAIKIHLPDVAVNECAYLQINDGQAAQSPMKEQ